MKPGGKGAALLIGGVATVSATLLIARFRYQQQLESDIEDLFARVPETQPRLVSEEDIAALPEPVRRWLRHAGVVNRARPRTARLRQEGEFRLREEQGWMPFTAEQYFTINPPGFIWTVKLHMFPLITVTGRDRYAGGEASIQMRALSLVPVADSSGGELNQGALLRYLGETIWFPAAVLEPYIEWEAVDANSAHATISDGGVSAPATFEFDQHGSPVRVTALRANDATGKHERWTATTSNEGIFQGLTVPSEGEVTWNYERGDFTYIRWRITEIEYDQPTPYQTS